MVGGAQLAEITLASPTIRDPKSITVDWIDYFVKLSRGQFLRLELK